MRRVLRDMQAHSAHTSLIALFLLPTVIGLSVVGCDKPKQPAASNSPTATPAATNKPDATPDATPATDGDDSDSNAQAGQTGETGTLAASAMFVGSERPKRVLLKNQPCTAQQQVNIPVGPFIVAKDMAVRNVVVFVADGLRGDFDAPKTKATLDQVGCQYEPHVQSVMVGQPITVINSDATLHNIHSFAKKQRAFNFGQPNKGMTRDVEFTREEFVLIKCDVHAWMSAYVAVFDHPYHAVTDKDGKCTIENIPPGTYSIGAWHEEAGELTTQSVTIKSGESTEIKFELK